MDAVTKLADLKAWMAQRLPVCPDPVMDQALRDAWREFARRSEWWRPAVDISIVADDTTYPFTPPFAAHVRQIAGVWSRSEDDVTYNRDGSLLDDDSYAFTHNDLTGQVTLLLAWTPGEAVTNGLRVRPVLVPKLATQTPPPVYVLERWGDALAACAVWQLAQQPGKAWSDGSAGSDTYPPYLEFARALSRARRENVTGLSADNMTVRGPMYPGREEWSVTK